MVSRAAEPRCEVRFSEGKPMAPPDALTGRPTVSIRDTERRLSDPAFTLATGTLLGRYVIVDQLGAGGMATVYVAYDAQLARRVAIKVLRPDAREEESHARMLREAQAMARLSHPNVLAVHDVGSFDGGVFIATEYVEGETLKSWMAEARPWQKVLSVLRAAGRGLEAAHAAGIVHRDFKPENVFLGKDGRVVVGDFGIARAPDLGPTSGPSLPPSTDKPSGPEGATEGLDAPSSPSLVDSTLTGPGDMVGTVGYLPPERGSRQHDDARGDQFSFSVTLYRALYRQRPFEYTGLPSYLAAVRRPPLPPPRGSDVPSWVHQVVLRGMSRDPSARFASMTELLHALDRDPTRRRRAWALAAVCLGVAAAVGVGWAQHQRSIAARCRVGETLVTATWSPQARAAVGAAIVATAVPLASDAAARTQTAIDAYAVEWARVHRTASEATLLLGQESQATMRGRLACLGGQREELAALVAVLSRADAVVVRHAVTAAYDLPSPRVCLEPGAAHAASLAAESPEHAARVTALRRAVAEAEAHRAVGQYKESLDVGTRAVVEARAIPDRESEAQLLVLMAGCRSEIEDDAAALGTFEEAFAACEAAGNDSLASMVAAMISLALGDSLADTRGAERWLAIAKGIREREGADDRADAEILESELALLAAEGHADRALPLHDRLVALLERLYGTSHPRIAAAIANRARDLTSTGEFDQAATDDRKAIAMGEQLFGPDVPSLSILYNNLGSVLTEAGRYPEARTALERALALVAPLGPDSPHNVLPLVSLSQLENLQREHDAALAAAGRGIAIVDASGDSEVRYLPALLVQQGEAQLARGDAGAAQASCARALAVEDKQEVLGPDKIQPEAEDALTCLGEAELALGRLDDAVAHLERSVSLTKRELASELPLARFALARALTAAKRDPGQALDLAVSARRELRATRGMDRAAAEVEAWLVANGRR
jgi:tetratricopeptide (TPR) repeat protein/predicted Ser/Thr protein kinase